MNCAICETRRPRRHCPGVRGEICAVCCGTEREVTIDCPLDCPYLQDAREHERTPEPDPQRLPNPDVEITDQFLEENAALFSFTCGALAKIALGFQGIHDSDVREALDALVRTYQTLQSGLVYETRPANLLAGGIQQRLREELEQFRAKVKEHMGMETIRDAEVLGVLIMLRRMEFARNNGRARSRAFIDFLRKEFPPPGPIDTGESGLVIPR